jgi:hypothetical protein
MKPKLRLLTNGYVFQAQFNLDIGLHWKPIGIIRQHKFISWNFIPHALLGNLRDSARA